MIEEVKSMIEGHLRWLKDTTIVKDIGSEWVEITTPYLDRHNDMLQYYIKRSEGGFLLSDGGEVIGDLAICGCNLDTSKRQSLLNVTLRGFGVANNDGRLEVHANATDFPLRQHSLIQAMLAVNDLFYLSQSTVQEVFFEDVRNWLDSANVRYTENVSLIGKSGLPHRFEFIIPKSRFQPERIVEAINHPTRHSAELLAFKWMDTRDARAPDALAFAILNDQEQAVSQTIIDALRNCDIHAVVWSARETVSEQLAA